VSSESGQGSEVDEFLRKRGAAWLMRRAVSLEAEGGGWARSIDIVDVEKTELKIWDLLQRRSGGARS
jgi:hypothetical protein